MKNIKDYNLDSLKEEFVQMGEKPFRAEQVFKWLYEEKVKEFDEMTNLSLQLREKLKEYIKLKFLKEALNIIKKYPSMITDYNRELEILYRINKRDIKTLVNKK